LFSKEHKEFDMVIMKMSGEELQAIVAAWFRPPVPEHLRDEFEERAAILEHDAGMPRAIAEAEAYKQVIERRGGA
jgi:hypothetical protein